jgi:peptidoglycan/LPS O-acetylase OafA/YrhL
MNRLPNLLQRDYNSLDFIRLCAAVAVIFTHSYPYALGAKHQYDDPLDKLTSGVYTFGQLAVAVFFIISGFLVAASMDRSRNARSYVTARVLRIFPGLIGVVLVTIFLIGPVFTTLSLSDYFRHPDTIGYFQVLLLYNPTLFRLPGVFETNAYPSMLNGSLWTLYFEIMGYGLILVLWLARLWRRKFVLLLWLGFVIALFISHEICTRVDPTDPLLRKIDRFLRYGGMPWTILWLGVPFTTGMVFYFYRDRIPMKRSVVIAGVLLLLFTLIVLRGFGLATLWMPTFGAYTLFFLATLPASPFKQFGRYGDFSYGMYIYAPLVHQIVTASFGGMMLPFVNFVLTAGITLIPAILSWYLIERPALRLKHRSSPKRPAEAVVPAVTGT